MVRLLSCSNGHYWEVNSQAEAVQAEQTLCPVCGQVSETLPLLDLEPSEPGPSAAQLGLPPAEPGPSPARLALPVIEGYELLHDLGKGPTGIGCFKARQRKLNRLVLLHVVVARQDPGQSAWGSLHGEAAALGKIAHPNVIHILEVGERERQLFYNALEWVEGPTLADKMAEGPLPLMQIATLLEILARTLQAAHDQGVVHRNLKPRSIVLQHRESATPQTKGKKQQKPAFSLHPSAYFPRIVDFGLARSRCAEGEVCDLELQGDMPNYLSPEQAWGRVKDIGPACDVYSLGAILFELLAGVPPFQAKSASAVLDRIQTKPAGMPSEAAQGKHRRLAKSAGDLEAICWKCLRPEPRRRYASAQKLAEDLQRYLAGHRIQAWTDHPKPKPLRLWFGQWVRSPLKVGFLCLLILVLPIAYYRGKQQAREEQELERARISRNSLKTLGPIEKPRHQTNHLLAQAQLEEAADRNDLALTLLNRIEVPNRCWEWHFLTNRLKNKTVTRRLGPMTYPVRCLAFSPDGAQLVAGAGSEPANPGMANPNNGEIKGWLVNTAQLLDNMPTVRGSVRWCGFSNRTLKFAVIQELTLLNSFDTEIAQYQRPGGGDDWKQRLFQQHLNAAVFHPHNGNLIALDQGGNLRVFLASDGTMATHPAQTPVAAATADSLLVIAHFNPFQLATVSRDGKQVLLVNDPTASPFQGIALGGHMDKITALAAHPESDLLVSVSNDGSLICWDVANTRQTLSISPAEAHGGAAIRAVAVSVDGKRIATWGEDETLRIWDPRSDVALFSLPFKPTVTALAFIPWTDQLAVAHGRNITLLGPTR